MSVNHAALEGILRLLSLGKRSPIPALADCSRLHAVASVALQVSAFHSILGFCSGGQRPPSGSIQPGLRHSPSSLPPFRRTPPPPSAVPVVPFETSELRLP
jgi:hypothetical protein